MLFVHSLAHKTFTEYLVCSKHWEIIKVRAGMGSPLRNIQRRNLGGGGEAIYFIYSEISPVFLVCTRYKGNTKEESKEALEKMLQLWIRWIRVQWAPIGKGLLNTEAHVRKHLLGTDSGLVLMEHNM